MERDALAAALELVGDRWTLLVLAALMDGPRRFGELQSEIPGIAPNVLSQRLRNLERHGLIVATPYSERPPRFVYEVSASARELAAPLRLLAGWGAGRTDAPRHALCGTPLELRWWCPACEQAIDDDQAPEELHYA
jgi:DNA-binding HxlR family transcriptional regulator